MACSSSHYKNFLDMGFFDELDESDFVEDFDLAVASIASKEDTLLKCSECPKTYKTRGGLQRHIKTKHSVVGTDDVIVVDKAQLENLLLNSVSKVMSDGCWPNEIKSVLTNFNGVIGDELLVEVNTIVAKFAVLNDPEKFFEEFYGCITINADKFLSGLPLDAANIVSIQLGELVFAHLKRQSMPDHDGSSQPPPILECEIDALQYVAGYVIHKFVKKAKDNPAYKSLKNQALILVLETMMDSSREQKLIDSLNRGGLTPISKDCELIFHKTEELFRLKTSVPNLRKIDIPEMSANLMCQADIVSVINCIVNASGCDIETEEKNNLFEKMIQLYLRVRSFALARDITSSCNQKAKKEKGLRKGLKRQKEDNP